MIIIYSKFDLFKKWYSNNMSKIDKAKEYINMLKVYMGIVVALMMGDISGTARLFNANKFGVPFWLGIVSMIVLALVFGMLARYAHKKIDELEEM